MDAGAPFGCCSKGLLLFSSSVVSSSLLPHGLQHTRLSCPSLSPGLCSDSYTLNWWCHPTIPSSVVPFLLPPSLPSIRGFSNELALHIRWSKYWSLSPSIYDRRCSSGSITFLGKTRRYLQSFSLNLFTPVPVCTVESLVISFLFLHSLSYPIPDFIELKLKLGFRFNGQEIPHVISKVDLSFFFFFLNLCHFILTCLWKA